MLNMEPISESVGVGYTIDDVGMISGVDPQSINVIVVSALGLRYSRYKPKQHYRGAE
jgi:hypothetical protein